MSGPSRIGVTCSYIVMLVLHEFPRAVSKAKALLFPWRCLTWLNIPGTILISAWPKENHGSGMFSKGWICCAYASEVLSGSLGNCSPDVNCSTPRKVCSYTALYWFPSGGTLTYIKKKPTKAQQLWQFLIFKWAKFLPWGVLSMCRVLFCLWTPKKLIAREDKILSLQEVQSVLHNMLNFLLVK